MSGYRVSETVGHNSHSSNLYDSEEDSESISQRDIDSSSSDMLNQMNEIDSEQIFRVQHERKASLTVQLPKDMCPIKV